MLTLTPIYKGGFNSLDFFFAVIFWVTYKLPIGLLPKPEYSGKQ